MARPEYPFHLPFRYTERKGLAVFYDIEMERGEHVKVVGDPRSGGYEWVIERKDGGVEFSDAGYGIAECALRDGLCVWLDEDVSVGKLRNQSRCKTATQLRAYAVAPAGGRR